jgi:hypothetical protein
MNIAIGKALPKPNHLPRLSGSRKLANPRGSNESAAHAAPIRYTPTPSQEEVVVQGKETAGRGIKERGGNN